MVANDGLAIVGIGHARGNEIGALYLLRSYQRRGIGKALMLRLLAKLSECTIAEAHFHVISANLNAIGFYKSLGANPVGRYSPHGAPEELVFVISTR